MENNNVNLSRPQLESLSTDELVKLADTYGIDIPPGLERIFIIEELLETADNLKEEEPAEEIEVNPSYSETALLPKQYNISFVEVIIRDPLWVFVFWEVKGQDREMHEKANDFQGYCLRVTQTEGDNSFDVSVGIDDNARYLGLPEESERDGRSYIVKLGAIRGGAEYHIADSQPFSLPKLNNNEIITEMSKNPLIRLSGIQDLTITKNIDRQARVKRQ
jgi:hypothetical protein